MTTTIPALLRDAAQRFGGRPALVSQQDGAMSYIELDRQADLVAKALIADGALPGDRAAIWAPNMWEWIAAAVGIQRAGGVMVPLNTRLKGGEVADVVRRAGLSRLFVIGPFLGRYYPQMLRDEAMPGLRRRIVLRATPDQLGPGEERWEDFLALAGQTTDAALAEREAGVTPDSIADIMFTSGTTGAPKGAIFDHRRSLGGGRAWANISRQTAEDRYCVFGPFSHNASYKAGWVAGLMTGSTLYWPEAYDAVSILDLIAGNRITVMPAPPTVFQEMLAHPNWRDWDISSYRFLSTGATVVPIELMKRLRAETPIREITTGYGMTECCGSATHTRPGDSMERVAYTVGTAIAGTEIAIAGPDGRRLEPGEQGEVLIRDDKLLIEYLDNPEATRATLDADGWLHSGDVGYLDADGYLKLTDRLKDMYIVGGFNVYPAEIEKQMSGLPGIFQSAIIGVPDQRLGEVGHAFIVRADGSTLTAEEVIAWSKANLANYKVPRGVTFIDALPMNSTGKVVKYALRQMLQSD
ncbi:3-[(3aS,4S,7aS)-7a-methyl-1,5-dioxo-octahydro-1H- inden-4-yl]propanoyl:CoA ligase [Sphingobium jiangsuense]|uniref:Acyl-CoA synthetase (AMP-forming)/AMP-acid ligase II n=1 Tax=Sphingobium jiangsuense TaxID=870476 RepID=A0A7W6BLE5_9SPHN|nr:AMP-binding protein [Sphingobium jiangsuense]MBB3925900.1 acyl-CoA synthetase (AMP-forming)/AMP-acid ligase II [Sphingobium jiangsuense]GLS98675.1 3-[(3aS,4S,7aS)-7a-methyl-1,5-dioxo-octahydro-1H- inden-4-yl]propanoyl:CoA ligase [Sphingobium jiangsuense]